MTTEVKTTVAGTTAPPATVELGHLTIQSLSFRMDRLEMLQQPTILPKIDIIKQLFVNKCVGGEANQHLVTSYLDVTGLYSLTDNIGKVYKYASHISTVVTGIDPEKVDRWALEHGEAMLVKKGSTMHDGICVENTIYNTLLMQRDLSVIPTELFSNDLSNTKNLTGYLN